MAVTRGRTRPGGRAPVTPVVALLLALLVGAGGCVANPVGPVSSSSAYLEKATRSIDDAVTSVETVRLAGEAELSGRSFTSYTQQVFDDALDGVRTAQDTFETIVPPDAQSEGLRLEVLDLLERSRRSIVDAMTVLQNGTASELTAAVVDLDDVAGELAEMQGELRVRS